jgi:threonine efflux protein
MSPWSVLAQVGAVWLLAVMTPGPNFLAVTRQAMGTSRRAALATALGVAGGTAVWVVAALAGLAVVLARAAWILVGLRWVGGAYLIYLGVRTLLRAGRASTNDLATTTGPTGFARAAGYGLATTLTNPKSALFFSSLFVTMLPRAMPLWLDVALLVLVVGISVTWYTAVTALFAQPRVQAAYQRARRAVDLTTGLLFVGLGGRLAWTRGQP